MPKDEKDDKSFEDFIKKMPEGIQEAVSKGVRDVIREANEEHKQNQEASRRAQEEAESEKDDNDEEPDWDNLGNKELAEAITGRIGKQLAKSLKPIMEQMNETRTDTVQQRVAKEFQDLQTEFKDVSDWKDEMKAVAKDNPGLSVRNVYMLAKSLNGEKVQALKEAKEKQELEQDPDKDKPIFGGLTPTSSVSVPEDTKMDMKEASDKAWEEAMGNLPPGLIGDAVT